FGRAARFLAQRQMDLCRRWSPTGPTCRPAVPAHVDRPDRAQYRGSRLGRSTRRPCRRAVVEALGRCPKCWAGLRAVTPLGIPGGLKKRRSSAPSHGQDWNASSAAPDLIEVMVLFLRGLKRQNPEPRGTGFCGIKTLAMTYSC